MWHRARWWLNRTRETLWARPVLYAALAIGAVAVAAAADRLDIADTVPQVDRATLEELLAIIATSMLSVATLAVASMVAAYASASSTATPRAFSLVIADDVSQTALSGFIGAFIFSIVALTAVKTGTYGRVGLFVAFAVTVVIFAVVIMLFLRWVDRIARLGRLGTTIDRVERAARAAIDRRRAEPLLGGVTVGAEPIDGRPVHAPVIGYVESIDVRALQRWADKGGARVVVDALPGTFVTPGQALAIVLIGDGSPAAAVSDEALTAEIGAAFIIGDDRTFEDDPRFGLVALAEIAARSLSPAVNDPGTAIDIVGTFVRLFARWVEPGAEVPPRFDRVGVPALRMSDMFDDAFTAIARDGAGTVEVGIRLQKGFLALASMGHEPLRGAAVHHSTLALARAERALILPHDLDRIRAVASRVGGTPAPG